MRPSGMAIRIFSLPLLWSKDFNCYIWSLQPWKANLLQRTVQKAISSVNVNLHLLVRKFGAKGRQDHFLWWGLLHGFGPGILSVVNQLFYKPGARICQGKEFKVKFFYLTYCPLSGSNIMTSISLLMHIFGLLFYYHYWKAKIRYLSSASTLKIW